MVDPSAVQAATALEESVSMLIKEPKMNVVAASVMTLSALEVTEVRTMKSKYIPTIGGGNVTTIPAARSNRNSEPLLVGAREKVAGLPLCVCCLAFTSSKVGFNPFGFAMSVKF